MTDFCISEHWIIKTSTCYKQKTIQHQPVLHKKWCGYQKINLSTAQQYFSQSKNCVWSQYCQLLREQLCAGHGTRPRSGIVPHEKLNIEHNLKKHNAKAQNRKQTRPNTRSGRGSRGTGRLFVQELPRPLQHYLQQHQWGVSCVSTRAWYSKKHPSTCTAATSIINNTINSNTQYYTSY